MFVQDKMRYANLFLNFKHTKFRTLLKHVRAYEHVKRVSYPQLRKSFALVPCECDMTYHQITCTNNYTADHDWKPDSESYFKKVTRKVSFEGNVNLAHLKK